MDNKVVVEIETDLATLTDATFCNSAHKLNLARRNLVETILDALSPIDKYKLEKYQEGDPNE